MSKECSRFVSRETTPSRWIFHHNTLTRKDNPPSSPSGADMASADHPWRHRHNQKRVVAISARFSPKNARCFHKRVDSARFCPAAFQPGIEISEKPALASPCDGAKRIPSSGARTRALSPHAHGCPGKAEALQFRAPPVSLAPPCRHGRAEVVVRRRRFARLCRPSTRRRNAKCLRTVFCASARMPGTSRPPGRSPGLRRRAEALTASPKSSPRHSSAPVRQPRVICGNY